MILSAKHKIKSSNQWIYKSWRAYWSYKKRWFDFLDKEFGKHKGKFFTRVIITSYRVKLLDYDNLVGGIKPILDWLTKNAWISDDNPEEITVTVKQRKLKDVNKETTKIFLS